MCNAGFPPYGQVFMITRLIEQGKYEEEKRGKANGNGPVWGRDVYMISRWPVRACKRPRSPRPPFLPVTAAF